MFSLSSARVDVAVNWGIAAGIYLGAGALVALLISRSHNWRPFARRPSNPHEEAS